jgi:hypothetical protein
LVRFSVRTPRVTGVVCVRVRARVRVRVCAGGGAGPAKLLTLRGVLCALSGDGKRKNQKPCDCAYFAKSAFFTCDRKLEKHGTPHTHTRAVPSPPGRWGVWRRRHVTPLPSPLEGRGRSPPGPAVINRTPSATTTDEANIYFPPATVPSSIAPLDLDCDLHLRWRTSWPSRTTA